MSKCVALATSLLLLAGCGATDAGSGGPGAGGVAGSTYHQDARPVLQARCAGCHVEGGVAPFALDTYEDAKYWSRDALAAIEAGSMPPWQPDPDCRRYEDERFILPEETAVLQAWVEGGLLEGQPSELPAEGSAQALLEEADIVARPSEAYTANKDRPDDYRCLPLTVRFDKDTFMVAAETIPDARTIVHHVIIFLVASGSVAEMEAKDAGDDGPGYTCYGGPGVTDFDIIGGWVPGAQPIRLPDGVAVTIPAGARLIMQVHYNTLAGDPVPDLTEFRMVTQTEAPVRTVRTEIQANFDIEIEAGDHASRHERDFVNRSYFAKEIVGIIPHMHVLGSQIRADVVRDDEVDECLVSVPKWDFNWQQTYRFRPGESVVLEHGDAIRLSCTYDNSPSNQSVINGEQAAPRDVRWGDGTSDEMCLTFASVVEDYSATPTVCRDIEPCQQDCDGPSSYGCMLDCMTVDRRCASCMFSEMVKPTSCGLGNCLSEFVGVQQCFGRCGQKGVVMGGLSACMEAVCPEPFAALITCMDPVLASGECDAELGACGGSM